MKTRQNSKCIFIIMLLFPSTVFCQTRVLDVPIHASPVGSNWCWAGCTFMATQYYGNSTSECEIVEWARLNLASPNRGTSNCCTSPTPALCYGGIYIDDLDEVINSENLGCSIVYSTISLGTLQTIINDNRPLIIQGHHNPNGGWHTLIITGYDGTYLQYNDPSGGSYITSYNDAITYDCLGLYLWRWQDYTHILTNQPCPINLNLTQDIDADADIVAQNNISISCEIGSNRNIMLNAGNSIIFNSGFVLPAGSTLLAEVITNPCQ